MSHEVRAILICDGGGCGRKYISDAGNPTKARRLATRDGWAAGVCALWDGRVRVDYCPECKTSRGFGRLSA